MHFNFLLICIEKQPEMDYYINAIFVFALRAQCAEPQTEER